MKNVVYIFCDELRPDALGCYGNSAGAMSTPNIDAIAAEGVLFENCFCNSPICVPSRASLITGLYPEDTAVYGNEASAPAFKLPKEHITFPELLSDAGYATASFGKTHLPRQIEPFGLDNQSGSDMRLGLSPDEIKNLDKVMPEGGFSFNAASLYPENRDYSPELVTANALKWIGAQTGPFFVRISYLQPHSPIILKRGYETIYEGHNFDGGLADIGGLSLFEKSFARFINLESLSEEDIRKAKVYYYGLVAWIDDEVGKVTDYLKRQGLDRDTVIVVGADHGALRGECRGLGKHIFNHASQAVPLIILDPTKEETGVRRTDICSNIDFARTLITLLSLDVPEQFKGRDLFSDDRCDEVYATIGFGEADSYIFPARRLGTYEGGGWPRRSCIRTSQYRLDMNVRVNGRYATLDQEDIFFVDCKVCPREDTNMVNLPQYHDIVLELSGKLRRHCTDAVEVPAEMLKLPDSLVGVTRQ